MISVFAIKQTPHYGGPRRSDGAHVAGKTYESHFHTVYAATSAAGWKTLVE